MDHLEHRVPREPRLHRHAPAQVRDDLVDNPPEERGVPAQAPRPGAPPHPGQADAEGKVEPDGELRTRQHRIAEQAPVVAVDHPAGPLEHLVDARRERLLVAGELVEVDVGQAVPGRERRRDGALAGAARPEDDDPVQLESSPVALMFEPSDG